MTTSLNPDIDYTHLPGAFRFALRQLLKGVNTCLPGEVLTYDAGRQRASVRPAVSLLTTDGQTLVRPTVADVPVLFPSGGGFALTFPLMPGDPVLLVYSQRGIGGWKRNYRQAPPDPESFFSERDAIAIPGFGPPGVEPSDRIEVDSSGIIIKSAGRVSIEAPSVLVNGVELDPHSHG